MPDVNSEDAAFIEVVKKAYPPAKARLIIARELGVKHVPERVPSPVRTRAHTIPTCDYSVTQTDSVRKAESELMRSVVVLLLRILMMVVMIVGYLI